MTDLLDQALALRHDGQPFALATVVARRAPVSAHLGDRAIVYPDGRMDGFVGGACSREIVRKRALEALRARHALLVSIRPDASATSQDDPEHVIVPMTCVSEGAIDVYIEPFLPARRLVVVGATPVAEALAKTAATMNYDVIRIADARDRQDLERHATAPILPLESLATTVSSGTDVAVVVASQGHYDEEALEAVLGQSVTYVGLVASRKRGATVRSYLEKSGVGDGATVHIPAGLDLGARTPPEVALSILAEIVQTGLGRELESVAQTSAATPSPVATTAIDSVCGMTVEIATARHRAVVEGVMYYFCGAGCRARFLEHPQTFLSARP